MAYIILVQIFATFCCMSNAEGTLMYWNVSNTAIPTKLYDHACGYDPVTENIFLYFGWDDAQSNPSVSAYSYNIVTNAVSSFPSITPLKADYLSPAYINAPYWYFLRRNKFGQFNPASKSITYGLWNDVLVPTSIGSGDIVYACIALSSDGNNMIVLGGVSSGNSARTMQIYDIVGLTWRNNGPNMNSERDSLGCIVSNNNYLYAIGGYNTAATTCYLDTIEAIDISNINSLQSWNINTASGYKLTSPKERLNCVLHGIGNNIYVIGGMVNGIASTTEVDIIDTTTHLVTPGPPLPIAVYGSCSVVVNDIIYILGGFFADGGSTYIGRDTIIISNLLNPSSGTSAPTTTAPTTLNPTTNVPTTYIPTTHFPTTNFPTTNLPTTFIPTTKAPTTNLPTTSIPTTHLPTTNFPTTYNPTKQPTTTTGAESGINPTQYVTISSTNYNHQHNDSGGNSYIILYSVVTVLCIGIVAIVICCILWKKNSNSKHKDEGNIVKQIHTQQMVEMHDLSDNYKVEQIEMNSVVFGEIEPNDIDKGNGMLHAAITPNGITAKQHVSDKNTESQESQQDEDLYSDVGHNTQEIRTPQYETTEGNDTNEDKLDEVEDMYKETDIVTTGA